MSTRLVLYDLIERYQLGRQRSRALMRLAGMDAEPEPVARRFWPVAGIVGAGLVGLGLILWLAANWQDMGRMGRFALLQGVLIAACVGAAARERLRVPLGLAALLCIGGLFAYFGQTYQTGADPWQLFALWAALALPLCLGVRSDVLWVPWALVVMSGISLWLQAHTSHQWRSDQQDWPVFLAAWLACGALVAGLAPALARWTGAGAWSMRTAATLAILLVMVSGVASLLHTPVALQYVLALGLLGLAGWIVSRPAHFEVFVLSAAALGLDTLLVAGLVRLLFQGGRGDAVGNLFLVGAAAAGLLAASVSFITRLARQHAAATGDTA